jgi:hypothetical protein
MHPLEQEIELITNAYSEGRLSAEEKEYLLREIRDVRAAQECADNEILFRQIVAACEIAIAVAG